jgi:hypothetical protein
VEGTFKRNSRKDSGRARLFARWDEDALNALPMKIYTYQWEFPFYKTVLRFMG